MLWTRSSNSRSSSSSSSSSCCCVKWGVFTYVANVNRRDGCKSNSQTIGCAFSEQVHSRPGGLHHRPTTGPAHYDSLVSQLSSRGQHRHKVTVSNNTLTEQVDGTERLKLHDSCLSMRHRFCLRDSINEVGGREKALLQCERARKGGLGSGGCGFVAAMLACWTLRVGPVSTSRRWLATTRHTNTPTPTKHTPYSKYRRTAPSIGQPPHNDASWQDWTGTTYIDRC